MIKCMVLTLTNKVEMKVFYSILFLATLSSCSQHKREHDITLKYSGNNIIINYNGNNEYMKIPFKPLDEIIENEPAYCIDTISNTIYTYVPSFGLKNYDLKNKSLMNERFLESKFHRRDHSFKLYLLNSYVIFSSYLQVLIFDKNLLFKVDLRNTIEQNACIGDDLHDFKLEIIGDTLLFKTIFVESSDFYTNKRFKKIYKDYEFILKGGSIICNNCDTCKRENTLSKQQMKLLLK